MSRKPTPDIMGNLMSGSAVIEAEQVSNKAINTEINNARIMESVSPEEKPESNKAIILPKNKEIWQDSNKEIVEEMKEKATFNLSKSTLEALEDSWVKLRRQLKGGQRITKTLIVERAIEMALDELTTRGEESELMRRLKSS